MLRIINACFCEVSYKSSFYKIDFYFLFFMIKRLKVLELYPWLELKIYEAILSETLTWNRNLTRFQVRASFGTGTRFCWRFQNRRHQVLARTWSICIPLLNANTKEHSNHYYVPIRFFCLMTRGCIPDVSLAILPNRTNLLGHTQVIKVKWEREIESKPLPGN